MDAEGASVDRALRGNCIADTSLLSNFVNTGYAQLLNRLLRGPVLLSPSVLDDQEVIRPLDLLDTEPTSEFLRPLYHTRRASVHSLSVGGALSTLFRDLFVIFTGEGECVSPPFCLHAIYMLALRGARGDFEIFWQGHSEIVLQNPREARRSVESD